MKEQRQRPEFFIALSKDVGTAVYLRQEAARYFDHLEAELLHARKEIEELREMMEKIRTMAGAALTNTEKDNGGPGCCHTIADILFELEGKQ